jgi:hypothetical protein
LPHRAGQACFQDLNNQNLKNQELESQDLKNIARSATGFDEPPNALRPMLLRSMNLPKSGSLA